MKTAFYARVVFLNTTFTLGPAYNEQIDAKKTALCRRVVVVTELFHIAVYDTDAKECARYRQVLVVSGTQCNNKAV